MITGTEETRRRLGDLVKEAREAEGLSHSEAADKSKENGRRGIGRNAWISVEVHGAKARPMTYRAIEYVLDWEKRSCEAVLQGGEITPRMKVTDVSAAVGATTLIASVEELDDISLRALQRIVRGELDRRAEEQNKNGESHAQ